MGKLQRNQSYNDLKKADVKPGGWHSVDMERHKHHIFDTETNGKKFRTHVFHRDDESHAHTTGEHDTKANAQMAAFQHVYGQK